MQKTIVKDFREAFKNISELTSLNSRQLLNQFQEKYPEADLKELYRTAFPIPMKSKIKLFLKTKTIEIGDALSDILPL